MECVNRTNISINKRVAISTTDISYDGHEGIVHMIVFILIFLFFKNLILTMESTKTFKNHETPHLLPSFCSFLYPKNKHEIPKMLPAHPKKGA